MIYDYINGDKFSEIADVSFNSVIINRKNNIVKKNLHKINDKACIIFCKTDFIDIMFDIISKSSFRHVLITHNSDFPINEK